MMNFSAAVARIFGLGVLMALAGSVAAQQPYPNKPIRFIVPYPPGGSTDPIARMTAQKLAEKWGQPVVVENRPGGNTIIGTEATVKATPDGYTVLLAGSSHVLVPLVLKTPYGPIKDFTAIAGVAKYELILVTNPSLPANNLKELIALAKSKPGQLNYVTWGSGSVSHLGMELLSMMTGIHMVHIPYKGTAPALMDVIGGHADLFLSTPSAPIPQIKAGKLKAIAVCGESRSPAVPDVPTFAESGLPDFKPRSWYGIVAPAGVPKAIVDKMSAEIGRIIAMPDTREKLNAQGVEPRFLNPEQFAALMKSDIALWEKVIKTANIKLEN